MKGHFIESPFETEKLLQNVCENYCKYYEDGETTSEICEECPITFMWHEFQKLKLQNKKG